MNAKAVAVQPRLIPRARLLRLLDEWERQPGGPPQAVCLPPFATSGVEWEWLPESARESGTGLALISHPDGRRAAIAPPFPFKSESRDGTGYFREHMLRRRTVGIILLRLGHYAVCIGDDETAASPKSGHRYVHGRHRAGGQSQHRYEHNREGWIRELYDELCEVASDRFREFSHPAGAGSAKGVPAPAGPGAGKAIEWLALGGDRIVLSGFLKRCDALGGLQERVLPWRVPVERPGADALMDAVTAVWSSRLYAAPDRAAPAPPTSAWE